ncbi:MAG TPA: zinc ribbon domain-containing protein [Pyrinomonadaceae bacterium]|nr:zinc ribbon domain-containing protein [Pyrinomonadaceae bacterium]
MFCPKCATQNVDGASYCRSCGANISLIPHALTGQFPEPDLDLKSRIRRRHGRELSLDRAFKSAFMGIAFLLVSLALSYSPMGHGWWFWMLIPAFSMMGSGIAQYIRMKEQEKRTAQIAAPSGPAINQSPRFDVLPAPDTGELMASPPSVTEGTTRHLGAEAPTRHLDDSE